MHIDIESKFRYFWHQSLCGAVPMVVAVLECQSICLRAWYGTPWQFVTTAFLVAHLPLLDHGFYCAAMTAPCTVRLRLALLSFIVRLFHMRRLPAEITRLPPSMCLRPYRLLLKQQRTAPLTKQRSHSQLLAFALWVEYCFALASQSQFALRSTTRALRRLQLFDWGVAHCRFSPYMQPSNFGNIELHWKICPTAACLYPKVL